MSTILPPTIPISRVIGRNLGVLAGHDLPLDRLARWAASAEIVLAADGGLSRLLAAGHDADEVVGDLDSALPEDLRLTRARVVLLPDQETTDAQKLLSHAEARGLRKITLVGLEGDRLDHLLATVHAAAASPLEISFGLRAMWGRIVRPGPPVRVPTRAGAVVSLLPLGGGVRAVELSGVRWPVSPLGNGADVLPGAPLSVSNEATGPVEASVAAGCALLLVGTDAEPLWL